MNEGDWQRVKEIFHEAVEYSGAERDAFVERACGGDAAVLAEVRDLLASHDADEGLMESPTFQGGKLSEGGATSDSASPGGTLLEGPGTRVGRYKLLQEIGSGGFGVVYLAEQTEPVKRRVALKIIKLGMDTKQVIARFEAERQALAMMDHPNIARVLDAGATETGRPFFVMELVRGIPITEYCDKEQLNTQQRLELFIKVCHAIQHAHQKGIIHRDIKPTNVLVTMHDDVPVPRVIDFGIAKATEAELTERTLFTEHGQMIGTPAYMSPEQAQMSDLDIDTRSDIYSLGVLLYELLTGTTPFSSRELREAGFGEIQRIIREEEPHKPSTRVSSLLARGQGTKQLRVEGAQGSASAASLEPPVPRSVATDIAKQRATDPTSLTRLLRGDLDWIVMKALEKNRTRRYETATGLAMDIQRHLDHEPVLAGPPSASYRLGKLARKHRTLVGGVAALFTVLLCSVVVIGAMYRRAEDARELALESQTLAEYREKEANHARDQLQVVVDFQSSMLSDIDAEQMGRSILDNLRDGIREVLESSETSPEDIETTLATFDSSITGVNATDLALEMIDEHILARAVETIERDFADQPLIRAALQQTIADTYHHVGLDRRAQPLQEAALQTRRQELGSDHPDTLTSINNTGSLLKAMGNLTEAEIYRREALERTRRVLGNDHPDTLASIGNMGGLLEALGRYSEGERYYREALEGFRRVSGDDHPDTHTSLNNLGELLRLTGQLAEAETLCGEALDRSRRVLGDDHPDTLVTILNMGNVLYSMGRLDEAEPFFREALNGTRRVLGDDHPNTLDSINGMGTLLWAMGKLAEAEPFFREAADSSQRVLGRHHPDALISLSNLGTLLISLDRPAGAEQCFREALEGKRLALGDRHIETLMTINNVGFSLDSQGKLSDAQTFYREALTGYRDVLGDEELDTLIASHNLGRVLRDLGRIEEGEKFGAEAVRGAKAALAPSHPFLFAALSQHGRTLTAMKSYDKAEIELLEAHQGLVETSGPEHVGTTESIVALVDLYAAWGKPEQAAEWRAKLPPAEAGAADDDETGD